VFIELPIQRVECCTCGAVRQVDVGFADERRSYTRAFERYVLELSKFSTMYDVSRHLGVSWDTVKDIQMRNLERKYSHISLKDLKLIAIDEISIGKNHQYLTIVLDLNTGAIVFTNEGKGAEALDPFWKKLKHSAAKIEAVAMDMSPAYAFAVKKNLPDAAIVFDHFHIIKMFNEKLAELRRDIQNEAQTMKQKRVIKGTRWLLLKASENLSDKHKEKLEEALHLNRPLALAYYMKEDLRQLWSQRDKKAASEFLDDWIARARSSGIRKLMDFSKTLASHRFGILAWYDFPISTGPLEGTNNKIKTLIKSAYGYRDKEFLKLKLYALHEAKFKMVG
jgi:transposase